MFDALPVLMVLVVFVVRHPGRYLPRTSRRWVLDAEVAKNMKDDLGMVDIGE